jgi:hypothetical protein
MLPEEARLVGWQSILNRATIIANDLQMFYLVMIVLVLSSHSEFTVISTIIDL